MTSTEEARTGSRAIAETLDAVRRSRVVAIVRMPRLEPDVAVGIAETLVDAGLPVVEFTLNTGGALSAIEAVARRVPTCVVGAGTVLSVDEAARAVDAGARLLVAPGTDPEVIAEARRSGALAVPGAFTATEVLRATAAGAEAVKVFPVGPVGPAYLEALRGPLSDVPFVPTGGLGLDDIAPFIAAGATAVGLGGCLVRPADPLDGLADRAAQVRSHLEAS